MANFKMGFEPKEFRVLRRKYGNVPTTIVLDGKPIRFRSKLEYRWANHLEMLKRAGEIKDWRFEQTTFVFDNTGVEKWIVDFDVLNNDDTFEYFECKGMLQKRDIDKLKCLNAERPEVQVTYVFAVKPKISVKKREYLDRFCKRVITNANTICARDPKLLF